MEHSAEITAPAPVAPGQVGVVAVTIRNAGAVVERYHLRPVGDAEAWCDPLEPVTAYPGGEASAHLVVRVPERALAGEVPLGVVVTAEVGAAQLTEEVVLVVAPTSGVDVALVPGTSHGRRRGEHALAIINRGNVPLRVRCEGRGDEVEVELAQAEPEVAPFGQVDVPVRVAHLRRQWFRPAGPSPFEVTATTEEGHVARAAGAHQAAGRLPRALPLAVIAGLALLLGGLALISSRRADAKAVRAGEVAEAAQTPLSEQAKAINDLAVAQGKAPPLPLGSPGNPGTLRPGSGASGAGGEGGGVAGAPAGGLVGVPFDRRFEPASASDEYEVPGGKLLGITDIVLENAGGDQGRITLERDGKVLLRADLAAFRDQDTHLVTPLRFRAGEKLRVSVACTAPGSGPACTAAALVTGVLADA